MLGYALVSPFLLLPRSRRFASAVRLALLIAPVLTRVGRFPPGRLIADSPREHTLFRILDVMTRYGCAFDPAIDFDEPGLIEDAMASRGGLLIVSPHAMLGLLIFRLFHDHGRPLLVLAGAPRFHIFGTETPVTAIRAKGSLFRVRTTLRRGGAVAAMIDQRTLTVPDETRAYYETGAFRLIVRAEILEVALRVGAKIIIFACRVERGRVRARAITVPPESSPAEAARLFARFAQDHVDVLDRVMAPSVAGAARSGAKTQKDEHSVGRG